MTFTNNTVTIGKYRVSSARRADDGSVGFILDEGGTLVMKTIPKGAKQPIFSSAQVVGYGDDAFRLDSGVLVRRGGFRYVAD